MSVEKHPSYRYIDIGWYILYNDINSLSFQHVWRKSYFVRAMRIYMVSIFSLCDLVRRANNNNSNNDDVGQPHTHTYTHEHTWTPNHREMSRCINDTYSIQTNYIKLIKTNRNCLSCVFTVFRTKHVQRYPYPLAQIEQAKRSEMFSLYLPLSVLVCVAWSGDVLVSPVSVGISFISNRNGDACRYALKRLELCR